VALPFSPPLMPQLAESRARPFPEGTEVALRAEVRRGFPRAWHSWTTGRVELQSRSGPPAPGAIFPRARVHGRGRYVLDGEIIIGGPRGRAGLRRPAAAPAPGPSPGCRRLAGGDNRPATWHSTCSRRATRPLLDQSYRGAGARRWAENSWPRPVLLAAVHRRSEGGRAAVAFAGAEGVIAKEGGRALPARRAEGPMVKVKARCARSNAVRGGLGGRARRRGTLGSLIPRTLRNSDRASCAWSGTPPAFPAPRRKAGAAGQAGAVRDRRGRGHGRAEAGWASGPRPWNGSTCAPRELGRRGDLRPRQRAGGSGTGHQAASLARRQGAGGLPGSTSSRG